MTWHGMVLSPERNRKFLGDPDPFVKGPDTDPYGPIIKQK